MWFAISDHGEESWELAFPWQGSNILLEQSLSEPWESDGAIRLLPSWRKISKLNLWRSKLPRLRPYLSSCLADLLWHPSTYYINICWLHELGLKITTIKSQVRQYFASAENIIPRYSVTRSLWSQSSLGTGIQVVGCCSTQIIGTKLEIGTIDLTPAAAGGLLCKLKKCSST